jgi:hypothetical protein
MYLIIWQKRTKQGKSISLIFLHVSYFLALHVLMIQHC